jgi:tRNA isopentenyl-2-thiomethyl-A-37 hydroxylase MiaE
MDQNETSEMGMNKTGIATAPRLSKAMIEASNQIPITTDGMTPEEFRLEYVKNGGKIGSVPPPASVKGMATSVIAALKGEKATLLIDKLAERLAFERSGTRLYEALMIKARALSDATDTLEKLEYICAEELQHFQMLWECIEQLGADPTAQTPSADIAGVSSQGLPKVLLDPRTTFPQCLEAIMIAELVDGEAWDRLAQLAEGFGQTEMAKKFRHALSEEREHQTMIRSLLANQMKQEAGVS